MPLRIKQKTKKDIQTPNPNKKCMHLKYIYITLPKKPILLANIVLFFFFLLYFNVNAIKLKKESTRGEVCLTSGD